MSVVRLCGSCEMGQHSGHIAGEHQPGMLGGWDCPCNGGCTPPDLSAMYPMTAPEPTALTESEREVLVPFAWGGILGVTPDRSDQFGPALFATVQRILAAREAQWQERLKAVEQKLDDWRSAKRETDERFQLFAAEQRQRAKQAEADKARAVAEAKVEVLNEIERQIQHEIRRAQDGGFRSPSISDGLRIVRALREEASGHAE